SLELTPGKAAEIVPQGDVQVSNASLGEKLIDQNGRTVVKVTYKKTDADSDEEEEESKEEEYASFSLCALTAGKSENAQVNLVLEGENIYKFELVGKNPVSLSGNYIDQGYFDQSPANDEDELDFDEGEDAYDLRDVSSDVEIDPDELDGMESDASRFEEVEEEKQVARPGKRAREVDDADEPKSAKANKKNKKLKKESGEAAPLPGGLKIQDATIGTGPQAKKGDKLQMRYVGKLPNGKVFDKNTKGKPFSFRLGDGQVIKGWDQGLVGMSVGGERTLTIAPQLGYGKRGSPPEIPPNTTLIFEVKLLAIN
ncbi:hypothetical protein AN958_11446, partial [Leucoagaricus sp. SymC.cos]